jgi:RNA polymerase subunit RPABC4/transcription elongation factor Spt4
LRKIGLKWGIFSLEEYRVQICSLCHHSARDTDTTCPSCHADLTQFSETAQALKRIQENERVKSVRITIAHDSCPACQAAEGVYEKDKVPRLPIEGCSHGLGCRCFYTPVLDVLYP